MNKLVVMINSLKRWWKGRVGEQNVKSLNKMLNPDKFLYIDDLMLQSDYDGVSTSQIDHCVLSLETGLVFIVETKNIEGELYGDVDDNKWTLRTQYKDISVKNYLRQNYGHIKTIQEHLNLEPEQIQSIVYLNKDKYNSNHHITDNHQKTGKTSHWFKIDCIVNTPDEYLNLIVQKTEAIKLEMENNPELKTQVSPMRVRQLYNYLLENNMNQGLSGMVKNHEHKKNVQKKRTLS